MLKVSIDIGSNSVVLLVARVNHQEILEVIYEKIVVTSLGKDIDKNNKFLNSTMDHTFLILKQFANKIKYYDVDNSNVIATATEASRVATNSIDFFSKVRAELKIDIIIISSYQEAFYTAKGVVLLNTPSSLSISSNNFKTIFDIGGASTELIKVQLNPFEIIETISLPIGSVRAKSLEEKGVLDSCLADLIQTRDLEPFKSVSWIAVAGTMTSLGLAYYNFKIENIYKLNSQKCDFSDFKAFVDQFKKLGPNQLLKKYPFLKSRIGMIKQGACVSIELLEYLNCEKLVISTFGLRHGTLISQSDFKPERKE